ncbi:tyrosine-type recombinase/integrase [Janthinobacterium sp. Mn2066]|uniref:tyrosine-type recombinase/integrase n=1 Tax=Janthinobacterium sp. Mn2066 TaxID=3395264 RepID=UPI003BDADF95
MSATLFRVGESKIWHYRFQVAGMRVQRTTRLTVKHEAEIVAARAYADAVTRANGGRPIPTLAELFAEWQLVRAPIASIAHRRSVDVVRRLHLYDLGDLPVSNITTLHIEKARNLHLVDHKPASANAWLRVIKLIVNWAVKREILLRLPWRVSMLTVQKVPRVILSLSGAEAWLAQIDIATQDTPEVAIAVRLLFGLGLREGEAATARWEWIDWERKTYTPGITKGREAEPCPMQQWLIDYLAPLRKGEGLIARRADGTQLQSGYARTAMKTANAKCRIKGLTPHRLRGSYATLLSEAGANIQTIQAVMRHKSPITTMAYLEKDMESVKAAQSRMAEKMGFGRRESEMAARPLTAEK